MKIYMIEHIWDFNHPPSVMGATIDREHALRTVRDMVEKCAPEWGEQPYTETPVEETQKSVATRSGDRLIFLATSGEYGSEWRVREVEEGLFDVRPGTWTREGYTPWPSR